MLKPEQTTYLASARVAHLATADAEWRPHVVPVCFVSHAEHIYIALDEKPKSVAPSRLKRVRNILANPQVSLVVDHYGEDWMRLSYLLISGTAALADPGTDRHAGAIPLLREKYSQYRSMAIDQQPVIAITITATHSWQADRTETNPLPQAGPISTPASGAHIHNPRSRDPR
jgi:coenzyme F420-0:L-glutamate ligase / coenzyme F420-1:gamma-L-glutamate ligase